jgi:23S rRNA (pseudouridine1915-N3)-methyltransferase
MTDKKRKLGIIAGGGSIPKMLIEECLAQNQEFVVMAIEGEKCSSEKLSKLLTTAKDSVGEITFLIGSSCGISSEIKKRADKLLSFSDMTFPHTFFRLMLTEQLYRAFSINGGSAYHK